MDYKARLNELVSTESAKNESEKERQKAYRLKQTEAFARLRKPLNEIIEAASAVVKRSSIRESFGDLIIVGPGSQETNYDIEPSYSGGLLYPVPEDGFRVRTKTTYNYALYTEPTERQYALPDAETLLEDLMTHIAKALASTKS